MLQGIESTGIRPLLRHAADAWNAGDLATFINVYAEQATYLSASGYAHGRTEILQKYRELFPEPPSMGILAFEIVECRFSNLILVPYQIVGSAITAWTLAPHGGGTISGHSLLTFQRDEAGNLQILQDASI